MRRQSEPSILRSVVLAGALAQTLFWLSTLGPLRSGPLPFDFVFLGLIAPALVLSSVGQSLPLGAGLTAAAFVINLGFAAQASLP